MEPGWNIKENNQEKYFMVLICISAYLACIYLLRTKLLLAEVLSPAPLLILFLFELNQHPKKGQDMHPCFCLQRRKDSQPPATNMGNTQLMHFPTSDTYQRLSSKGFHRIKLILSFSFCKSLP